MNGMRGAIKAKLLVEDLTFKVSIMSSQTVVP